MTRRSVSQLPSRADGSLRKQDPRRAEPAPDRGDAANPLANLQQAAGNGAVAQVLTPWSQRSPRDALEREADVAATKAVTNAVNMPPLEHGAALDDRTPSGAPAAPPRDAPPGVQETVRAPGRPLDADTRAFLEPRLGHDLSGVRIHDDARANQSAYDVLANAYTVGSHIVFDRNRFAPHSSAGQRLLAHELTHVAQQTGSGGVPNATSGAIQREPVDPEELRKRLAKINAELASGGGVRTKEATEKLQAEKLQLETELGIAPKLTPPGAPSIDWEGGNLRGLPAETEVQAAHYPNSTQLPKGFKGVDFVEGGTRTPLTGTARVKAGKLPLTSDSFSVEGGTAVQLKTLKNSLDYYQQPGNLRKTLDDGLSGLANVRPGEGKSETVGGQVRRVEVGQFERKILHVELDSPPTPDQQAQLEQVKAAGKSFGSFGPGEEIEVVVNWPKVTPTTPPPASKPGGAGTPGAVPNVTPGAPVPPGGKSPPPATPVPTTTPEAEGGAAPTPPTAAKPPTAGESPTPAKPPTAGKPPSPGKPPSAAPKVDAGKAAAAATKPGVWKGVASTAGSMAAAAALDYLNAAIKAWIAEIEIEQHTQAEMKRLEPAIEAMIAKNPKQIHAVIHIHTWVVSHDVVSMDRGVEEKTGFPMVLVHVDLAEAPVKPTQSSNTEDHGQWSMTTADATYSVLLIDVEAEMEKARVKREEERLNERARALAGEAKARGQVPPPPAPAPRREEPPGTNLVPAPLQPAPSFLPNAPPPSTDEVAFAEYAKKYGEHLIAEGVRLRNSSAPAADRSTFKLRVQVWRGQMRKLMRESSNYKAKEMLDRALHEFDERMQTLGSELGIEGWKEE